MTEGRPIIAVDLGGTRFRVALVDTGGVVLDRVLEPSRSHDGPRAVVDRIAVAAGHLLRKAGGQKPLGVGVAVAGPIDGEGVIHDPPNLKGWGTVPFREMLQERFDVPLWVGNDANVAVLGEHAFGAARGVADAIYMTVSTGVGGGVLSGGTLVTGWKGLGAELGHLIIEQDGRRGPCGHFGCLESLVSGPSIAARAREALEGGQRSSLAELSGGAGGVRAEHVFKAAAGGDRFSAGLVDRVAVELGSGIVCLVHIFNPKVFVLGGGVTRDWDQLEAGVRSTMERQTFADFLDGLNLATSRFGDDVGLVGAAALVLRETGLLR